MVSLQFLVTSDKLCIATITDNESVSGLTITHLRDHIRLSSCTFIVPWVIRVVHCKRFLLPPIDVIYRFILLYSFLFCFRIQASYFTDDKYILSYLMLF